MRFIIKPSLTPQLHLDVTNAVVSTIAHELARVQGGNDVLNWLEAERALREVMGGGGEARAAMPGRHDAAEAPPPRRTARRAPAVSVDARLSEERVPMSATRG